MSKSLTQLDIDGQYGIEKGLNNLIKAKVDNISIIINSNGELESTAVIGNQGPPGIQGPPGAQGIQGNPGVDGLPGTDGLPGANGLPGEQGIQGIQGIQGLQGNPGSQGIQGETGLQGIQGIQGETGIQGEQGIQGQKGGSVHISGTLQSINDLPTPPALDTDAYIIAGDLYVWNGVSWDNVGRIQGPQGEIGTTGLTGLQGIQGEQGLQGNPGAQGLPGEQGIQGIQGEQGLQGIQGIQGIQGETGVEGPMGDNIVFNFIKEPVDAVSKINIDLTVGGNQPMNNAPYDDDIAYVGDRVLIMNQTDKTQNGIYVLLQDQFSRSTDAYLDTLLPQGTLVYGTSRNLPHSFSNTIYTIHSNTPTMTIGVSEINIYSLKDIWMSEIPADTNNTLNTFVLRDGIDGGFDAGSVSTENMTVLGQTTTLTSVMGNTGSAEGIDTLTVNGDIKATGDIIGFFSDERLKENIVNIDSPIEKIKQINGVYYNANELAQSFGYKNSRQVGVIAQEVEVVMPEIIKIATISKDTDVEYKTVQYDKLVPLLIECIKELNEKIEVLSKR